MNEAETIEKKAMTPAEKAKLAKYLKAALAAGVVSAGVGVALRNRNAKKDRAKAMNIERNKNVIVVPVRKESFMEGLPTPEEFAKEHASSQPAETSASVPEMTQEEIDAKKKDILKANSRRFDFFGKSASQKKCSMKDAKEVSDIETVKSVKPKKEVVVRDASGRFSGNPENLPPETTEKAAEGFISMITHPKRTAEGLLRAATVHPAMFTAGGLASVYLATKIVDAVNDIRKKRSDEKVDAARDEYVKLLESNEKAAEVGDNPAYGAAALLGGSFLVPATLAAIVVNRVMQKRKEEEKKRSQMSDSFPDEPMIMYKTSAGKDMEISAESALASIIVKTAMFLHAENHSEGIEKDAFLGFNEASQDEIVNNAIDVMERPENNANLLGMTKAYVDGDEDAVNASMKAMQNSMGMGEKLKQWWRTPSNAYQGSGFKNAIVSNKRFQDMMTSRFNTDPEFGKYRDELVDGYIGKTFKKGGFLYNLMSMLAKATGYGNSMIQKVIGSNGASTSAADGTNNDQAKA